jgi:hypothetical protein
MHICREALFMRSPAPAPLDNASRQRDREGWMPGLNSGDFAASELNPLVFQR